MPYTNVLDKELSHTISSTSFQDKISESPLFIRLGAHPHCALLMLIDDLLQPNKEACKRSKISFRLADSLLSNFLHFKVAMTPPLKENPAHFVFHMLEKAKLIAEQPPLESSSLSVAAKNFINALDSCQGATQNEGAFFALEENWKEFSLELLKKKLSLLKGSLNPHSKEHASNKQCC